MGCSACARKKGKCANQYINYRNLRTKLTTLYNKTTEPVKKAEYKDAIDAVDLVISEMPGKCATEQDYLLIKAYVDNEYK